jgi:hypothetical protein
MLSSTASNISYYFVHDINKSLIVYNFTLSFLQYYNVITYIHSISYILTF